MLTATTNVNDKLSQIGVALQTAISSGLKGAYYISAESIVCTCEILTRVVNLESENVINDLDTLLRDIWALTPSTVAALQVTKCDGTHGGPKCQDDECWNDDIEHASADKKTVPLSPYIVHSCNVVSAKNQKNPYDIYQPLTTWPSIRARSNSKQLNTVCLQLLWAEHHIEKLLNGKVA